LLLVDLLTFKTGKEYIFGYVFKISIAIFFLTSVFLNKVFFVKIDRVYLRYGLLIVSCGIASLVYGFLAFTIAVNFHFAIGGRLYKIDSRPIITTTII
ncbi:MAG: hypothetical protein ACM32I_11620, partial [Nitrospirota bacterium]